MQRGDDLHRALHVGVVVEALEIGVPARMRVVHRELGHGIDRRVERLPGVLAVVGEAEQAARDFGEGLVPVAASRAAVEPRTSRSAPPRIANRSDPAAARRRTAAPRPWDCAASRRTAHSRSSAVDRDSRADRRSGRESLHRASRASTASRPCSPRSAAGRAESASPARSAAAGSHRPSPDRSPARRCIRPCTSPACAR